MAEDRSQVVGAGGASCEGGAARGDPDAVEVAGEDVIAPSSHTPVDEGPCATWEVLEDGLLPFAVQPAHVGLLRFALPELLPAGPAREPWHDA